MVHVPEGQFLSRIGPTEFYKVFQPFLQCLLLFVRIVKCMVYLYRSSFVAIHFLYSFSAFEFLNYIWCAYILQDLQQVAGPDAVADWRKLQVELLNVWVI